MASLADIKDLKTAHVFAYSVFFAATIGPGFLVIWHYHQPLLGQLDVVKLTMMSAGLTLPVSLINGLSFGFLTVKTTPKDSEAIPLGIGAGLSSIVFYFALFLAYIFSLRFRTFVWIVVGIELPILLLFTALTIRSNKNQSKVAPQ